jgi:hypothetical protein
MIKTVITASFAVSPLRIRGCASFVLRLIVKENMTACLFSMIVGLGLGKEFLSMMVRGVGNVAEAWKALIMFVTTLYRYSKVAVIGGKMPA